MAAARDWTKPPPDAMFNLRVPVEYASIHAAVSGASTLKLSSINALYSVSLPAIISMYEDHNPERHTSKRIDTIRQLTGEDSYQIAISGVQGIRVEIVTDAPPPPDEPPYAYFLYIVSRNTDPSQ